MPLQDNARLEWLYDKDIRPYVFVRRENRIKFPGALHRLDWFPHQVLYKNPLEMDEIDFANGILDLEAKAFGPSGMAMPVGFFMTVQSYQDLWRVSRIAHQNFLQKSDE